MQLIEDVYAKCKAQVHLSDHEVKNFVKDIYAPFTAEQISNKISELLSAEDINAEVVIIFQTIENLHKACPDNLGDWYFALEIIQQMVETALLIRRLLTFTKAKMNVLIKKSAFRLKKVHFV